MAKTLVRGDDTDAFGGGFVTIKVTNNTAHTISKAEWRCGKLLKVLDNPSFPYRLQLSSAETAMLQNNNEAYMAFYDEQGRKLTEVKSKFTFKTDPQRV